MASLGGLVAGVAHELNTPIGNAVTVASTLSDQADSLGASIAQGRMKLSTLERIGEDFREGSAIILRELQRTIELVGHFKQVAVDQTGETRRTFRLDDLIHDVVGSLQPQFRHGAVRLDVDVVLDAEFDSYPGALGQVLMNLISNARVHGFDASGAGHVRVSSRALPSGQIEISVRDDGKGIPTEIQKRVFDPFFTTRLGEGGSGLGLSIAFNLVTNVLGGTLHLESEAGIGTSMIVCVPRRAPAGPEAKLGEIYHGTRRS
jgi:signal transduction histidine kinase